MTPTDLPRRAVAPSTVYCKVDDSGGPIATGDRLVPSTATFGHAMRAIGPHADSVIIGRALAPFDGGCGLIPISLIIGSSSPGSRRTERGTILEKFLHRH